MSDLDPRGGTLKLYRGKSIHEGRRRYEDASRAVHMDAAGAYLTREKYLVMSRELPVPGEPGETVRLPVEPLVGASARATSEAGSPMSNDEHELGEVTALEYGGGTFLAAAGFRLWRRTASGWEQLYEKAVGDIFTILAYGHNTWLAADLGGDVAHAAIYRSSDGGNSWSSVTLPGPGRVTLLAPGEDSSWVVGLVASGQVVTYRSLDGGATWQDPRAWEGGTGAGYFSASMRIGDSGKNNLLFRYRESGFADPWVYSPVSNAGPLAYHSWTHPGQVSGEQNRYRTQARTLAAEVTAGGWTVAIARDGRLSRAEVPTTRNPYGQFSHTAGVSGEGGGTTVVNDLAYDPVGNALIAVGGFTPSGGAAQARAWRSTDDGLSWSRLTDVEDAMQAPIVAVAVDDDGNALYLNALRWAHSGATRGLEGGEYNVYVVSYFNTHAGKFVYDMHMETVTTEDGGSISFSAPTKDEIFATNAVQPDGSGWMTDEHRPLLGDLRFDVYVQAVREPIGDEDVAYTIRYAFTESFPEDEDDDRLARRTLDALPLGRHLLSYGLPTTAVFEKRHTALHNGRVWGMAAQDESRWGTGRGRGRGDPVSPEIANQAQRFVLSYSEVGWANLISDRSFIVIQPTQSTRFTGLLSTPSGLLVMFENEIHLVTGDPAFGNVSVELYLDMVGCDEGTHPAKVGGVPFTIWRGKLWVLQAGQAQQIGAEQWLASDPFVRVSPEPQTRSLLALTKSGLVFRYMLDDQFWLTDPVTRHDDAVVELFTNCACESGDNTRFMLANGELWCTRSDREPTDSSPAVPPDAPHVLYQDIDFGALDSRSSLYLVKVGLEGPLLQQQFDRGAVDFDADALPALFYLAANEGQAAALQEVDPVASGGRVPYLRANLRGSNTVTWRLPLGRTKGSSIDVRLELRGFSYDDVLKLPLQLFFARGGVVR